MFEIMIAHCFLFCKELFYFHYRLVFARLTAYNETDRYRKRHKENSGCFL